MIEIFEGFWCDPFDVKAVKVVTEESCAFWLKGQSAENGFVVDYKAEDLVQQILDAREGLYDEDEYEGRDETEDEEE